MSDNERMDAQDKRQDKQDDRADVSEKAAVTETARQDAEHVRQDEATALDHDRLERIGIWFRRRWIIPVAFIFLAGFSIYNANATNTNTQTLSAQSVKLAVIEAVDQQLQAFDANQTKVNQQQAIIFNQFFSEFIAEQNYLCRIASSRAIASGLESPPPGICNVTLGRSP